MRMLRHACEKLLSLTEAEIRGSWNCRQRRVMKALPASLRSELPVAASGPPLQRYVATAAARTTQLRWAAAPRLPR